MDTRNRFAACLFLLVVFWTPMELAAQKVPDDGNPKPETSVTPYLDDRLGDSICNSSITTIPDNSPAGVTSTIDFQNTGTISAVTVELGVTHSWVGDLIISLEHDGMTSVLMDRPGVPTSTFGCSGNNISAEFDDSAAQPVEAVCPPTDPVLNGSFQPVTPLSVFDGADPQGVWTLTVSDNAPGDTGTLDEWCLNVSFVPVCNITGLDFTVDEQLRITGNCDAIDVYANPRAPVGDDDAILLYSSIPVDGEALLEIPFRPICDIYYFPSLPGGPVEPYGGLWLAVSCPVPILGPWGLTAMMILLAGCAVYMMHKRRKQMEAGQ